eukprot:scaffold11525_cov135-Cylindrotheca_fusiformis.AAC.2
MASKRIPFNLNAHCRSFSSGRPARSSTVETPFQSHLQSATMRHRQTRTRQKDTNRPELREPPKQKTAPSERIARGIPSKSTDVVRRQRRQNPTEVEKTATVYSTPSATDMYRANKAGIEASPVGKTQSKQRQPSSPATRTSDAPATSVTTGSSPGTVFLVAGLVCVAGAGIIANSPALQEQYPILQDVLRHDYLRGFSPSPAPVPPEDNDSATKKRWFSFIWRSDGE